jgi:hypothetical protein
MHNEQLLNLRLYFSDRCDSHQQCLSQWDLKLVSKLQCPRVFGWYLLCNSRQKMLVFFNEICFATLAIR